MTPFEEHAHRNWIDSLPPDELRILHIAPGYKFTVLMIAWTKNLLAYSSMEDADRLRLLAGINGMTDMWLTPQILAAIPPLSDSEMKMMQTALDLSKGSKRLNKSFDLLTEHNVFMKFVRLNDGLRVALEMWA